VTRYPVWRLVVIGLALLFGLIYTLPNFYGEAPAVQISSLKATVKVDEALEQRAIAAIEKAGIEHRGALRDAVSVKIRFPSTDIQIRAKDTLEKALNPDPADPTYIAALNLLPNTPRWLISLRALPMYLGLDLRGGVHFLMQVDTRAAIGKRIEQAATEIRGTLRDKDVRHGGIERNGDVVEIRFRDDATRQRARDVIIAALPDYQLAASGTNENLVLTARLSDAALRAFNDSSLQQNISTLSNRINELGVAEPVIQRQGQDRIVVQLPGVQDTTRAKDILGRTATLEARLVDLSAEAQRAVANQGPVPFGSELFRQGRGAPVVLKRQAIFTGEQLTGAASTFDENQQAAVAVNLNDAGGRTLREVSRANIKKPMAVVLFEKGRGEVLTVATIQSELGSRFQITGMGSPTCRCCFAPARWRHRWRSSRSGPSGRASGRTTSARASSRSPGAS
jgi:preprotein translocase subunit SecD